MDQEIIEMVNRLYKQRNLLISIQSEVGAVTVELVEEINEEITKKVDYLTSELMRQG